jgi:hypothetical protein
MPWILLAILLFLTAPLATVRAEATERWLFVPVAAPAEELPGWMPKVVDELVESAGAQRLYTWSADDARVAFERRHSTEPSAITQNDIRTLERLSDAAIKSLSADEHTTALRELAAANELYERSPDEFNRLAPQQVLDLCLFRARAFVEAGEPMTMVQQRIRDCRVRIPLELEPNLLMHTNPTIRRLVAEVTAELALARTGRLRVRGQAGSVVRVDGVDVGRMPPGGLPLANLLVGTHRVSVISPEGAHRVYVTQVTAEETSVDADAELDATLHTRPYLHLRQGASPAAIERVGDTLHTVLDDAVIVLVQRAPDGGMSLRRPATGTSAVLPPPASLGSLWADADRALAIARLANAAAVPPSTPIAAPEVASARRGRFDDGTLARLRRGSYALLGLTAASTAASLASYFRARRIRREQGLAYDRAELDQTADPPSEVERAQKLGKTNRAFSGISAATLSTGLVPPLLARFEHRRAHVALAVSLAAAGAGFVGASVVPFVRARSACEHCAAQRDDQRDLGVLLVGHGVGLVAAPILSVLTVHWPWRAQRDGVAQTALAVLPNGFYLQGTF